MTGLQLLTEGAALGCTQWLHRQSLHTQCEAISFIACITALPRIPADGREAARLSGLGDAAAQRQRWQRAAAQPHQSRGAAQSDAAPSALRTLG